MNNSLPETTPQQHFSEEEINALHEKAEMDLLRDALKRTHKERFLMMTTLMKMNHMLSRAKITFTPYTLNK